MWKFGYYCISIFILDTQIVKQMWNFHKKSVSIQPLNLYILMLYPLPNTGDDFF